MTAADGEVEITGNGPRFRLREMSVDDFPAIAENPEGDSIEVAGKDLIEALNQVGVAASGDEARPTLTGVLFEEHEGALRLVATDSYRLAVRDVPSIGVEGSRLVPYRALRELQRTVGDGAMSVILGERAAMFETERGRLTVRIIDATFPNYRQLLPDEYPNTLEVSKEALLEAVGRAALVAEDHIPVRLNLHDGGVELSVVRQEVGEETEHIEGAYKGEEMTIAFNTRYLTDGAAVVAGDTVVLETIDSLKPGLLHGADGEQFRYLLMPVRL